MQGALRRPNHFELYCQAVDMTDPKPSFFGCIPRLISVGTCVIDCLKWFNTPIAQLGTVAGVSIKPSHMATAATNVRDKFRSSIGRLRR